MSRASAKTRAAAARTIAAVRFGGRSLDQALASEAEALQPAQRPLHAELCYGALRHYRALEHLMAALMKKPLARRERQVHGLLMAGIYELWRLNTPTHAAVAETVNAVRELGRPPLRGLTNAVLRRFDRERESLVATLNGSVALATSHPDWLCEQLQADWPDAAGRILQANNERAPMWLRVNSRKTDVASYNRELEQALGAPGHASPHAPAAIRLEQPVGVASLPGFAEGSVSVQDLAAQLVAPLLDAQPGMRVLDACAAPGGKSAHLLERADNALDLLAIDVDETRLERVAETLARLGLDAQCRPADAAATDAWWDGRPFQRILIDAPCSGSGVIRRHPDIKSLRRASDIAALAGRQLGLLRALWPLLAPDGCLVYATCSVLRAENHDVIQQFSEIYDDVVLMNELRGDNNSGLMQVEPMGMQVLPGDCHADGFFLSLLRKRGARSPMPV